MSESRLRATDVVERALAAALVGVLAALWVRAHGMSSPEFVSDFDQVWAGARALLGGEPPYEAVGPSAPFRWKWPLYYPLPALLLAAPLAALPILVARMVFAGVGAAIFTFAISREGWSRWPILLSVTFYVSVDLVQWSPLMAAAFFIPALAVVAPAKPNFALPMVVGTRDLRTWVWLAAGFALLLAASFAVRPGWFAEWTATLRQAPHFIPPIARRGGFLLVLAALRWRRPEARWLLALSIIPQAPSFYDQLLLVAVCTRWWETAILSLSTFVLFFYVGAHSPQPDYLSWGRLVGDATVWFCFLPMLALVLRRPNEGEVPDARGLLARLRRTAHPRG